MYILTLYCEKMKMVCCISILNDPDEDIFACTNTNKSTKWSVYNVFNRFTDAIKFADVR